MLLIDYRYRQETRSSDYCRHELGNCTKQKLGNETGVDHFNRWHLLTVICPLKTGLQDAEGEHN